MDQLGGINTIKRINSEIIGILRYDFGLVYFSKITLDKIDVKILSILERMKLKHRGTTRWRYYTPIESLGFGLRSSKSECLIELIKLYKSTRDGSQARKVYKLFDDKKVKSKRMKDQIYNLSKEYKIEIEEIDRIINNEVDVAKEIMEKVNKFYISKWKELKRAGEIIKGFQDENVDQKITSEAWKECYLNKQLMGSAIAMQEGASIVGKKLAMVRKDASFVKCSIYNCENETLDHILSNCSGRRKDYIERHDIVGKQVYKALGIKYKLFKHYINEPVTIRNRNIELYWNKRMVKGKSSQPDIVLYNYEKKEILIFDISVVKKKYLNKTFKDKQEKYNQLGLNLKLIKNFNYYKVIPIIITND